MMFMNRLIFINEKMLKNCYLRIMSRMDCAIILFRGRWKYCDFFFREFQHCRSRCCLSSSKNCNSSFVIVSERVSNFTQQLESIDRWSGDEKCSGKFDTKRLSYCLLWHRDFERAIKIIWLSEKRSFAQLSDKSQMRTRQRNEIRIETPTISVDRCRDCDRRNKKVYTKDASVWVEQFIFYYYLSRQCVLRVPHAVFG